MQSRYAWPRRVKENRVKLWFRWGFAKGSEKITDPQREGVAGFDYAVALPIWNED